jgi:hypothetical protein
MVLLDAEIAAKKPGFVMSMAEQPVMIDNAAANNATTSATLNA